MLQRLQNLHLDQFSFWFGALSGILATWLLLRLQKNLSFIRLFFTGVANSFQNLFQINIENQIRRETIAYAQQSHVA